MKPYYEADGITIYHGDALDVLASITSRIGLLVTDPPYGVEYVSNMKNRSHQKAEIANDRPEDQGVVQQVLKMALERLDSGRHFYVFGVDCSGLTVARTTEIIWDKGDGKGMGDLSLPWRKSHETITFGVWHKYPSQAGRGALSARLRRGSVIHCPPDNNGRGAIHHPTAKPILLLRQLIESSSLIGETVLDPFMGAGSTLMAARAEGRKAIGIEIEERYCEIAARRLNQGVLDFGTSG